MNYNEWMGALEGGLFRGRFAALYGEEAVEKQTARYLRAIEAYGKLYGTDGELYLFSAPGRTEIGGNHTDHQRGRVLAAAVQLDAIAVASKREDDTVRIQSEGHRENVISLAELTPVSAEKNTSNALVRGVAARFRELGYAIGGLNAYTTSDVFGGSGLSSSAAYEVLVGTIFNGLYNDGAVPPVTVAQIGQVAENRYFGKPCGLMDQTASAVGGLVMIDFENPEKPVVENLSYDFAAKGYALCVVNTGGSHADLTDEYAAIPAEMRGVAEVLGSDVLRGVSEKAVLEKAASLRKLPGGDRAILRALHFLAENERVTAQLAALREDRIDEFLRLVRESGRSSYCLLQNVVSGKTGTEQGLALALALSERVLGDEGACRVHGGGFAGTIQAYVPFAKLPAYRAMMEQTFGEGSCTVLRIRPCGGVTVKE